MAFAGKDSIHVGFDAADRIVRLEVAGKPTVFVNKEAGLLTSVANQFSLVGDLLVPDWIEVTFVGDAATPTQTVRIEVRGGVPRVVDVEFHAHAGQGEIRRSHLRAMNPESVVGLFALFSAQVSVDEPAKTIELRLVSKEAFDQLPGSGPSLTERVTAIRGTRANRKITPEFLREVADVYRAHMRAGPTRAVKERFFVSERAASGYVQQARKAGFLPPTTRGKRKA